MKIQQQYGNIRIEPKAIKDFHSNGVLKKMVF
jgi:hypothetical protein